MIVANRKSIRWSDRATQNVPVWEFCFRVAEDLFGTWGFVFPGIFLAVGQGRVIIAVTHV